MRLFTRQLPLVVLFMVLATIIGCLKVPLGDPETSKSDPTLTGVWVLRDTGPSRQELVAITPYDSRTSLLTYFTYSRDDAGTIAPSGQLTYKLWLTPIKDATFATLQPVTPVILVEPDAEVRYPVLRLNRTGDRIDVRVVSENFVNNANVSTPDGLLKLVTAHVDDPELYENTATFERVPPARVAAELQPVLDAFHHGK